MTYHRLRLALLASALLLTAACADDPIVNQTTDILSRFNANGEAYMTISLDVPIDPPSTTRATGTYVDGDEEEYKVNNATVAFFYVPESNKDEIPSPNDLKFKSAYKIGGQVKVGDSVLEDFGDFTTSPSTDDVKDGKPASNYVTQTHTKVFKINNNDIESGDRLFAYVIVNRNADIRISSEATTMYLGTHEITSETTFKDFSEILDINPGGRGGFTMTNAPMATLGCDDTDFATKVQVLYLPELNANNVFHTLDDATSKPALVVNVERMVAKIEVKNDETTGSTWASGNLTGKSDVLYNPDAVRWVFENRANQCYNVRHASTTYLAYEAEGTKGKRFVEKIPVINYSDEEVTNGYQRLYRILWAEDQHYTHPMDAVDDTKFADPPESFSAHNDKIRWGYWRAGNYNGQFDKAITEYEYYKENTMDAESMTQDWTSRVAVRIPFSAGKRDETKLTTDLTDKDAIAAAFKAGPVFSANGNVYNEDFYTSAAWGRDIIFQCPDTKVANPYTIEQRLKEYIINSEIYRTWKAQYSSDITPGATDYDIITIKMLKGGFGEYFKDFISDDPYEDGKFAVKYTNGGIVPYGKATVQITCNEEKVSGNAKAVFNSNFEETTDDGVKTLTPQKDVTITVDGVEKSVERIGYQLQKLIDEELDINCYLRGYAHYKVLVRHFPDTEVSTYDVSKSSAYTDVYSAADAETRAQNYLGRYGVVRNTWYTIYLSGVRHLGEPGEIPYKPIPDDEVDNYLSVKILVNKWATREQHNTL